MTERMSELAGETVSQRVCAAPNLPAPNLPAPNLSAPNLSAPNLSGPTERSEGVR